MATTQAVRTAQVGHSPCTRGEGRTHVQGLHQLPSVALDVLQGDHLDQVLQGKG